MRWTKWGTLLVCSSLLALLLATATVCGQAGAATMAAGEAHCVVIRADGSLWAWGDNSKGQLGLGTTGADVAVPTRVDTANDWASVSCATAQTLAIKSDGSLWAWGTNYDGRLGLGDTTDRSSPTRVGTENDWAVVACGSYHTLALKKDGSLWAWGQNYYGQLGLSSWDDAHVPTRVGAGMDWAIIAPGQLHSLAIKKDGGLWSWGKNFHGALGLGDSGNYKERWAPTQVTVPAGTWAAAAGCSEFSLGIMTDGSLWSWGWNSDGQLGLGDGGFGLERNVPTRVGTGTNWASVASGAWCDGVARQTTSAVWTWGDNWSGQLGQGAFGSTDHVLHYVPAQEITAGTWTSVVAGWGFMLAAKSEGSLWSCGVNGDGQLGLGDLNNRHTLTPLNFSLTPPDTTKPVPKALANVTVKKGKKAKLRFRVSDDAATCTVVIRIKRKAKTVMTLTIAAAATNVNLTKSFTCRLKKGAYKWYVYAADPAGNKQAMPGWKKLTVK